MHKINEALKTNTALTKLDISINPLWPPKNNNNNLKAGAKIGPEGAALISEGLRENTGLKILNLDCYLSQPPLNKRFCNKTTTLNTDQEDSVMHSRQMLHSRTLA